MESSRECEGELERDGAESGSSRALAVDDSAGTPRARLDLSVGGRPKVVFVVPDGQPGPSLLLEATDDGALRLFEDCETEPVRLEISVGAGGRLRLGGPAQPPDGR